LSDHRYSDRELRQQPTRRQREPAPSESLGRHRHLCGALCALRAALAIRLCDLPGSGCSSMSFRGAPALSCHSEERSDEESVLGVAALRSLAPLGMTIGMRGSADRNDYVRFDITFMTEV